MRSIGSDLALGIYVYGPSGLAFEQINNSTSTVQYLHHDQAGSTRLITGSTGTVEGSYTYDAYGNQTGHTGTATTPLGWDGQYTSADTGLIYLRARVYDPSTVQFLTVDPLVAATQAPYNYADDNPVNRGDASGLSSWNPFSESFWTEGNFISESPLNPIPYYEAEIESYENGCGYFASVAHGLEGAIAGTALLGGGEGEDEAGTAIEDALAGLTSGNSPGVYTVDSPEELQQIYDELSVGGKPATPEGYDGEMVKLPNGTRVGLRNTSSTGGPTIDINTGSARYRIHLNNE
jgi:RHS repeat-associated protein